MADGNVLKLIADIGTALATRGERLVTAESCTGGGLAQLLTSVPGSSAWFECGFVTYSNRSKTAMLGVPADLIARHGAVSEEVARAMAEGAMARSGANHAVAITGIAGPSGGSPDKPIGTVWIAWFGGGRKTHAAHHQFQGDREQIRSASVRAALEGLIARVRS